VAMQDLQRRAATFVADIATQAASGGWLVFFGHTARYGSVGRRGKRRCEAPQAPASDEMVPEHIAHQWAVEIAYAGDARASVRVHADSDAACPMTVCDQPLLDQARGWIVPEHIAGAAGVASAVHLNREDRFTLS